LKSLDGSRVFDATAFTYQGDLATLNPRDLILLAAES